MPTDLANCDQDVRTDLFSILETAVETDNCELLERHLPSLRETSKNLNHDCDRLLMLAVHHGHLDSLNSLLSQGTIISADLPIHSTSISMGGDIKEMLEVFLQHGWDVNSDDPIRGTALRQAISKGDIDLVQWLIDKGADVNLETQKGHLNYRRRHRAHYDYLGTTPLDYAATRGRPDILQLLISQGALLEKSNPMHAAVGAYASNQKDCESVLQFLLDQGLDISALCTFPPESIYASAGLVRATPLHHAAAKNRINALRFLIRAGADTKAVDSWEIGTPLDWAKEQAAEGHEDYSEIVDLLERAMDPHKWS